MKKKTVVATVLIAGFLLSTMVYAASQDYGPGSNQVDVKALRQFQKETLPLRDEIAAKRLELRNEYAQPTPDRNKIATLEKEIIDLRTKVQTAADKNGVAAYGAGGGYGRGYGRDRGMMHGGGYGRGSGRGYGMMARGGYDGGCGSCPMW